MPNILYISTLCSERVNEYLFKTSIEKPVQSAQKFHRLIVKGIQKHPETTLKVLSAIPVVPSRHKRVFWKRQNENENGINFDHLAMINLKVVKNFTIFFNCFFSILFWNLKNLGNERVIVIDVLNLTTSAAAALASKLTFTKTIGILTDMPGLMVTTGESSFIGNIIGKSNFFLITMMSSYVFLTEQMNDVLNKKNKPYIIMEGLVDSEMKNSQNLLSGKSSKKVVLYAGGLYEKYGIKKLIDGFRKLSGQNVALQLFGEGPMVNEIKSISEKDPRISFGGMVPNNIVVREQLKATLLVNPRPSDEEFTKYSFPSKNMEYMVSGTPVVTTPLPGMPMEYHEYVHLFENESVDGIHDTLKGILELPSEELHALGTKAKKFVLKEKNNLKQAERIIDLTHNLQ